MSVNCLCGSKKDTKTKRDPLLTILIVFFVVMIIVGIGTIGFRVFAKQKWIDSFVNGSLVFTSTSMIEPVTTYDGKVFMAIYNLISAVAILVLLGTIIRGAFSVFEPETNETTTVYCKYCDC